MSDQPIQQAERRGEARFEYEQWIRIARAAPYLPISDASVLNVSSNGIAIRTRVPLNPGDRLSFTPDPHLPPVLGVVLAREPMGEGEFRVRCQCVLGSFENLPFSS